MSYEAKLKEMGYTLEKIELNTGRFFHAVQVGDLVYTAGQVSAWGSEAVKGKVSSCWGWSMSRPILMIRPV